MKKCLLLISMLLFLFGCNTNAVPEQQAQQLLIRAPLLQQGTLLWMQKQYEVTLLRDETGIITVTLTSDLLQSPVTFSSEGSGASEAKNLAWQLKQGLDLAAQGEITESGGAYQAQGRGVGVRFSLKEGKLLAVTLPGGAFAFE